MFCDSVWNSNLEPDDSMSEPYDSMSLCEPYAYYGWGQDDYPLYDDNDNINTMHSKLCIPLILY